MELILLNHATIRQFRQVLRQLEREIGWQLKSETECCGVTVSQCHIILEIGNAGECALVDLAATLRLDPSTMSRNINSMVDAGLVNRITNPDDRRYVALTLTEQGRQVYESIENVCNANYLQIFNLIPEEKHAQVMESFALFTTALQSSREGGQDCSCCNPNGIHGGDCK